MKKFLAMILCMVVLLSAVGCVGGAGNVSNEPVVDPAKAKSEAQYACGKAAYEQLNTAADICIDVMDSVYNAWYYAIYTADDYMDSLAGMEEGAELFASKVGIPRELLEEAYMEYSGLSGESGLELAQMLMPAALTEFKYTVSIVEFAYKRSGAFEQLDAALSTAKAELKTMMELYSDYSEYPTLKAFYAEVNSYAEFAQNPSGSFQQLKTTIDNYETAIRTYKSELSFMFED